MQENSSAKKRIPSVLQEVVDSRQWGSSAPLMLAVFWAGTALLSAGFGAIFTTLGLFVFLERSGNASAMAAFSAMACAFAVVPYVLSRSIEGSSEPVS